MFLNLKNKIKSYFSLNKKTIFFIIAIISFFLLSSENTFAESDQAKEYAKVVGFIDGLLKVVSLLLALVTYMATIFLDPAWISGSLFGLDKYFKDIWILVSNVVYFVFAFILIWIAFMNIIGKGDDKYQLKKALPRFVIGILIVPFTWFIIQFVLSMSAMLTMAALTLPSETFPDFRTTAKKIMIPQECVINLGSDVDLKANSANAANSPKKTTEGFFDCGKPGSRNELPLSEIMSGKGGNSSTFGIIATYTYGIISIENLDDLKVENIYNGVKKVGDLIVKIGIDLLFILIYAILMITLGIALATRGIYLWVYTILSPVFGLMYFFDKKDGGGGESFIKNFSITNFIALAMVPVYTMLALSFGLLFIFVVGHGMSAGNAGVNTGGVSFLELDKEGITLGDGVNQFSLKVRGSVLGSVDSDKNVLSFFSKEGSKGLGAVGTIIIQLFSVVILWMAVMAALSTSKITAAVTEPIRQFGTQVGGLITKLPTYAPVFPGGQSMKSMGQAARSMEQHYFTEPTSKRARELTDKFTGEMPLRNAAMSANNTLSRVSDGKFDKDSLEKIRTTLSKAGSLQELHNDSESQKLFLETAKRLQDTYKVKLGIKDDQTSLSMKEIDKVIEALDYEAEKGGLSGYGVDILKTLKGTKGGGKGGRVNNALKGNKEGSISNNTATPDTTGTKNTSTIDEKSANITNAIGSITVNNDNDIQIGGKDANFAGYTESTRTIDNVQTFAKSLKEKGIGAENKDQFKDLITKLGIEDEDKIKELETALGIKEPASTP